MGGLRGYCGLTKEVNTFCDLIRGDNIDIMEDINVDRVAVGGQTRSADESYKPCDNTDTNANTHQNNFLGI